MRQGSHSRRPKPTQPWPQLLAPFAKIQNDRELFDGGRGGVRMLLKATHSPAKRLAAGPHDRPAGRHRRGPTASDAHQQMIEDMIRIFEAQRLVSLNTLFDLADNLESVSRGEKLNTALAGRLAARISEIQLPRSALHRHGKELAVLRLLDRTPHRRAAQTEPARRPSKRPPDDAAKAQGSARPAGALPARHAGRLQLHPLRSAGRAGAAHQSAVRAQPRFYRHPGRRPDLEGNRGVRHRLARQRRRTAGRARSRPCPTRWPKPSRTS